ncbi:protein kinase [Oscillatoria sp. FACHB-1407]|uniref:serine/threonine-protein kinase n=1 Tax=Oscillatoria sp. FACHB-1407 TaxID=2692847 RepID=UPI00168620E5|nr:serine/threonine-protein kinase [Oscillatoria sp. FACHB-1407]MBD2461515.1 protein kinase [Oscillatoria sp. FACHB-1407]
MSNRCSQGHQNPPDSRFCRLCGEKLTVAGVGIYPGMLLGDRYRLVRELGHGGFGRTYLAEDINRFNEPCVLKEFAPQVRGTYALQKSEELFEREAGVLYKLQHPQIPRFREMFRANYEEQGHLFLVQDFVEGSNYNQLLMARKQQGQVFSEAEVAQLLRQLLPVLQYIHSIGVIHRDISPDNLILRSADQLPVLIDFGGVKQVAAAIASQFVEANQVPHATRLGKIGYAPPEQMQTGQVYPQSDLYALAVTALVLLTGREPQEFISDAATPARWQAFVTLSPMLSAVLSRMLAPQPSDRFQSAAQVLQMLGAPPAFNPDLVNRAFTSHAPLPPATPPSPPLSYTPHSAPQPPTSSATVAYRPASPPAPRRSSGINAGIVVFLAILGAVIGVGWWARDEWLPLITEAPATGEATNPDTQSSDFSPEERARKAALRDRREALGIDAGFLVRLTDATFRDRHPELQGRTLTTDPSDAQWRAQWDAIASEWLDQLEQSTSAEARRQLGSYDKTDRDAWKQTVNQLYVSSRALYDLADAQFFHLYPEQREENFLEQPIGQVWHAIAFDAVQALQSNNALERIQFAPGTFSQDVSGTLNPGEGRVFIANLRAEQILRLSLQVPPRSTQLSVYVPRPTVETPFYLEDSADVVWSGTLTQSGYYEIVVVSIADQPINYNLTVAVDNVTSAPVEPTEPEAPDAKN